MTECESPLVLCVSHDPNQSLKITWQSSVYFNAMNGFRNSNILNQLSKFVRIHLGRSGVSFF